MRRSLHSGFTLLEMLIGLMLLGLMTLALFGALRFGTQSWERAEAKSLQVVDLAIVESMLRREIAKAFPLRVGLSSENKIAFEGDESSVKFFSALPAHFSTGGLSLIELRHEPGAVSSGEGAGGELVLRHALQNGLETDLPSGDDTHSSRLLRGVGNLSFGYFGSDSDATEPTWRTSWTQSGRVPKLVRIRYALAGNGVEREIILALQIGEEAGCYQAAFHRVCGARR
jgi:general secretion pathway protein J